MGIGVVLLFYAIGMMIAASVAAVTLGVLCALLTHSRVRKRKRAIWASVLFPFACTAFAGVWFIGYAVLNDIVFNRDPGLGDSWGTPLPNGYALNMIDTTDQGTVYDPHTQSNKGSIGSQDDAVFGVREVQVAKNLIFGARDNEYFSRMGQESKFVDVYFELNTKAKTHNEFRSLTALEQRAASQGVTLKLRSFESVFSDYRTTWFDYAAGVILFLVPGIGFVLLVRWVWKLRREGRSEPNVLAPPMA